MQEICSNLHELLSATVSDCKSESIALSGGLDSSILAFCLNDKKINAFTTIAKDFISTDLVYSQLVAKQIGLPLEVQTASIEQLLSAIDKTIKLLKVFNPIEIRNAIVMFMTISMVKEKGYSSIITGDGADELFAGYSFFQKMTPIELQKDLERIWQVMHFPTKIIADSIGVDVEMPFLNDKVVEYAKSIPADLKVHEEKGKKFGKWILRKSFERVIPEAILWREKSAMQDGSGTAGLTSFFASNISDSVFKEKLLLYLETEKVRLGTKESLYYYEIYRKYYDPPAFLGVSKPRCPECNGAILTGSHFCRMCGSFPI
ncbi:MAG: asparagine synthase C-terminal domain-containing protein [Thaumarchaeota archaeon]|nr:asparagine synthase C-terminal domain-containing protein [Nitrososphaerota archaeon]MBI3641223.1 asparagine synthase C-terminal domain-containing protein [Nitrososphaerota archaeon]